MTLPTARITTGKAPCSALTTLTVTGDMPPGPPAPGGGGGPSGAAVPWEAGFRTQNQRPAPTASSTRAVTTSVVRRPDAL
ncbi:hypothetical protein V8H18_08390 [Lautropia mirabilis]